jgi:predicted enzyme related to lactoylglutathione lyase
MANAVYSSAKKLLLDADIDLLVDTIKVTLIDSDYTYSAGHDYYNDVAAGARIATATLGTKTTTAGTFDSADPTFTSVAGGNTVTGMIVWKDTGVESTSPLIAYYDTNASAAAISFATSGGNITVGVSASGWFAI